MNDFRNNYISSNVREGRLGEVDTAHIDVIFRTGGLGSISMFGAEI